LAFVSLLPKPACCGNPSTGSCTGAIVGDQRRFRLRRCDRPSILLTTASDTAQLKITMINGHQPKTGIASAAEAKKQLTTNGGYLMGTVWKTDN